MSETDEKLPPFSADTLIAEAESRISWTALKAFYRKQGIKCLDCPAAMVETFAEGAKIHGFELEPLLEALNSMEAETPFDGFPLSITQKIFKKLFGR